MGNGYDVKITVLKRFDPAEVFEKSPVTTEQPIEACSLFKDFQEFIVSGPIAACIDGLRPVIFKLERV